MTVEEKIKAISEKKGWSIAYDGCHRIYYLANSRESMDAYGMGYEILDSSELPRVWDESCALRFVSHWPLLHDVDENTGLNIEQFEGEEE